MEVPVSKVSTSTGAPALKTGAGHTASSKPRQVSTTPVWFTYICRFHLTQLFLIYIAPPEWSVMNDPAFSRRPRCAQVNQARHCSCDAGFHMSGTSDNSICQGELRLRLYLIDPCGEILPLLVKKRGQLWSSSHRQHGSLLLTSLKGPTADVTETLQKEKNH